jgi:hypothetical protein
MHIHRIHPIKLYCILLYHSLEAEILVKSEAPIRCRHCHSLQCSLRIFIYALLGGRAIIGIECVVLFGAVSKK